MAAGRKKVTKLCGVPLRVDPETRLPDTDGPTCTYHRTHGKVKCIWHWLMKQPIDVQIREAKRRLEYSRPFSTRDRVPEREWPAGERWCAGCQSFVPMFYAQGSRCRACNSRASHASHIQRTYDLSAAEYERLLAWQGGVCFICGQRPRSRRLAVDHDHRTGQVRGLLCSNDEHGCNMQLRRLLNDVEMARRALEYVETHPLQRMREGEPPRAPARRPGLMDMIKNAAPPPTPLEEWDPFAA